MCFQLEDLRENILFLRDRDLLGLLFVSTFQITFISTSSFYYLINESQLHIGHSCPYGQDTLVFKGRDRLPGCKSTT